MNLDRAEELVKKHLALNGLVGWRVGFNRSKKVFGQCFYNSRKILLSAILVKLNTEGEVLMTILHEIAHALAPGDNHGNEWASQCHKLGIFPARCYDAPHRSVVRPVPKYILACPSCAREFPYFRKTTRTMVCSNCCKNLGNGKYDERFKLVYK